VTFSISPSAPQYKIFEEVMEAEAMVYSSSIYVHGVKERRTTLSHKVTGNKSVASVSEAQQKQDDLAQAEVFRSYPQWKTLSIPVAWY
jgi:hypothetical protein